MRTFRGEICGTIDLLVFGPGERLAAATARHDKVDVWNCVTGQLADPWRSRDHEITDIGFLPDGRVIACVSGQPLQVFDPNADDQRGIVFPTTAHELGPAVQLAIGPDAVYSTHEIAHARNARSVLLLVRWRPTARKAYEIAWTAEMGTWPAAFAASPDGRYVAYSGVFRSWFKGPTTRVVLLHTSNGTEVRRLTRAWDHWMPRQRLRFSPDGRRVLASPDRGLLCIWDVATGELKGQLDLPSPASRLTDAAFHPSGRWIITSGFDGHARVWDAERFTPITAFQWNIGSLLSVAISSDGNLAAAGEANGNIVVWDWDL